MFIIYTIKSTVQVTEFRYFHINTDEKSDNNKLVVLNRKHCIFSIIDNKQIYNILLIT